MTETNSLIIVVVAIVAIVGIVGLVLGMTSGSNPVYVPVSSDASQVAPASFDSSGDASLAEAALSSRNLVGNAVGDDDWSCEWYYPINGARSGWVCSNGEMECLVLVNNNGRAQVYGCQDVLA